MRKINSKSKRYKTARTVLILALAPITLPFVAWRYFSKRFRAKRHLSPGQVRVLDSYLWSSEHSEAYARIVGIRENIPRSDPEYFELSRALTSYLAHLGNAEKALEEISSVDCSKLNVEVQNACSRIKALCLYEVGRKDEALELISSVRGFENSNQNLIVAAGVASDENQKIEYFNRVFASCMLTPLNKIDPTKVLRLDNIKSEALSCSVPDIGCVSVIFPIFNAEDTIEAAVRSILDQSYSNLELLLCDDYSTDGTAEILARISRGDHRVKVLTNQTNLGAYKTRNAGLKASSGEFVMVHDSDDWSHPQRIEKHIAAFQRDKTLVACGSHWVRVTPSLEVTSWRLEANPIRPSYPSFTVRRRVFEEIGDWDEVRISGDAEYMYRVGKHYGETAVAWIEKDIPLALSLSSEQSLTGASETHVSSTRHGLRRYYHEAYKFRWRKGLSFDPGARSEALMFAPKAMVARNPDIEKVQQIVQADFRLPNAVKNLFRKASKQKGRTAIMHVPEIVSKLPSADVFCDELFEAVKRSDVTVIHNKACVDSAVVWRVFADGQVVKLVDEPA